MVGLRSSRKRGRQTPKSAPRYLFIGFTGIGLLTFAFVMGLWMVDVAFGAASTGQLTTNGRTVFNPTVTFHVGLYLLMGSFFAGLMSIGLLASKYIKQSMVVDGR